jgi:O-antigen/teichoic acid export membrane protein
VRVAIYTFQGAAINVAMSAVLIPRFDLTGALIAATAAQFCIVLLYHYGSRRIHAAG